MILVCIKQKNLRAVVWGEAEAQDTFLVITEWGQNAISKFCVFWNLWTPAWECQIHKFPWCSWENRSGFYSIGWKRGLPPNISILTVSVELHLTLFIISIKIPRLQHSSTDKNGRIISCFWWAELSFIIYNFSFFKVKVSNGSLSSPCTWF